MKLLITGFSNSGKTTIFNALTGLNLEVTAYPTLAPGDAKVEPHTGIVNVPDERVDRLCNIYKPKKKTYATIEYIDYIGLAKGNTAQNSQVFNLIKDSDAIVHVIREFENPAVLHPAESIDPVRDAGAFETELILGDLELVEKRLERMALALKKGDKERHGESPLLLKCREALENESSLRNIDFTEEEKKIMLSLQFLSTKPEISVLNIGENDLNTEKTAAIEEDIKKYFQVRYESQGRSLGLPPQVISLCGKAEMEISQLNEDEKGAFLDALGIREPSANKLCRISHEELGLITFFTVGDNEVKAWTIKNGTEALKAAGRVHSDMERGFIRAEVIDYESFISSDGSMVRAKEKGLVRLEGKNYIVKDGDIINFKFNI